MSDKQDSGFTVDSRHGLKSAHYGLLEVHAMVDVVVL
jgi:hypothetical protein